LVGLKIADDAARADDVVRQQTDGVVVGGQKTESDVMASLFLGHYRDFVVVGR
jgi:hypothetical protein